MKKVLLILFLALAGCTPLQYVYVDPKDSVVKKQRIIYNSFLIFPIYLYHQSIKE